MLDWYSPCTTAIIDYDNIIWFCVWFCCCHDSMYPKVILCFALIECERNASGRECQKRFMSFSCQVCSGVVDMSAKILYGILAVANNNIFPKQRFCFHTSKKWNFDAISTGVSLSHITMPLHVESRYMNIACHDGGCEWCSSMTRTRFTDATTQI